MKKIHILSVFVALALTTSTVRAHESVENAQNERTGAILSFAMMGAVSAVIHKGGNLLQLSGASQGILHTANVLFNLGEIADKPVLKDLGSRALIAGMSAKIASTSMFKDDFVPWIPFIGQSLKDAAGMGVGVTTVALYSSLGQAYEALKERTGMGAYLGL